ncbi:hypothetical protein T4B_11730 [Trichinella pseudospiralis]|uniref:Uncharacterized protein n=1 Tax=Trichinella pseudospiralis TaxID=6337 RepID=A0A0V1K5P3_TRIPS|nr:hypothetical protein T4B_11730 [Trichinella pseudospiralis]KRZ42530.1 hypothetical protein T4C_3888 [Trichinella pseudospiralis]
MCGVYVYVCRTLFVAKGSFVRAVVHSGLRRLLYACGQEIPANPRPFVPSTVQRFNTGQKQGQYLCSVKKNARMLNMLLLLVKTLSNGHRYAERKSIENVEALLRSEDAKSGSIDF